MKANELSNGDWLYNKNIGKPMQVYPMMFSQMFRSNSNATTEDYNIFPINLTPEILESNQFVHGYGDSDFYDYEKWEKIVNDKTIRVIKDSSGWFCRVDDKTMTRSMGISPFVHIVQHIIRIGGVEYEIKL